MAKTRLNDHAAQLKSHPHIRHVTRGKKWNVSLKVGENEKQGRDIHVTEPEIDKRHYRQTQLDRQV